MNVYGYVYMFTNRINGKLYIGQHKGNTVDQNYLGSGKLFKKAKDKYGIDNFKFNILGFYNTKEELDDAEINSIKQYNSLARGGHGYNVCSGGHNGNVWAGMDEQRVEEYKNKISNTLKKQQQSEETKQKRKQTMAINQTVGRWKRTEGSMAKRRATIEKRGYRSVCKICGSHFIGRSPKSAFCSPECRKEGKRRVRRRSYLKTGK